MKINIPEIGLYEQDDSNLALWAILLLRAIQNNELFTNQAVTMLSTEALPYCATPVRSLYGSDGDDLLWRPLEWLTELKGVIDREDGVYYEIMPAPMCLASINWIVYEDGNKLDTFEYLEEARTYCQHHFALGIVRTSESLLDIILARLERFPGFQINI